MSKPLTTLSLTDLATASGGIAAPTTKSWPNFDDIRSRIDSQLSDARSRFGHHSTTLPTVPSVPSNPHHLPRGPIYTNCFPHVPKTGAP